jgi:hypothetical protein
MNEESAIILIDRQSRNFVYIIALGLDNIADIIKQYRSVLALWTADVEIQMRYYVL